MLGKKIAELRNKNGLSQYELAERLGFSRGKLANYEQGSRQPNYETLQQIADYFDVSLDYLLGRDKEFSERENYFNLELLDLLYDLFDEKQLQPIPKTKIENGVQKKLKELYEEHKIQPNKEISDQILNEYAVYPNIKIIPKHLIKEVLAIKETSLKGVLCEKLRSLHAHYKLEALKEQWGDYKNESNSRNIIKLDDIIEHDNMSYRGRLLTKHDRSRILNMLEILFPEN